MEDENVKSTEREKYEKWLEEFYPETYSLRNVEAIGVWIDFGYGVWLHAKDDLSRELLGTDKK